MPISRLLVENTGFLVELHWHLCQESVDAVRAGAGPCSPSCVSLGRPAVLPGPRGLSGGSPEVREWRPAGLTFRASGPSSCCAFPGSVEAPVQPLREDVLLRAPGRSGENRPFLARLRSGSVVGSALM